MIDEKDIERLDERYVQKDACTDNHKETDKRIDSIREGFVEMKTKLNMLIGILSAIAVPVVGIAIKLLFGA